MLKKIKIKKRKRIVVCVGSTPIGPNFPPQQPNPIKTIGAKIQGVAQGIKSGLRHPVTFTWIASELGKKTIDSLTSDQLVEIPKAFSRGFNKGGANGAYIEMAETFKKSWLDASCSGAVEIGLKESLKFLDHTQKQHIATHIKEQCSEHALNEVRKIVPELPTNPGNSWVISIYYLFQLVSFLAALGFFSAFLDGYSNGVDKFNQEVEKRGNISVREFVLNYYFGDFYFPILAYQINKKDSLLNCCFILDDCYPLGVDINF